MSELVSAVWLSWCLAGRNGGRVGGTYARANIFVAVLAGEGGLPTSRSMIEIQGIEFIHFWRRDRKVGVGPAIGSAPRFHYIGNLHNSAAQIDPLNQR
jgi:hypothetical protein